jgi:hypothetical protein
MADFGEITHTVRRLARAVKIGKKMISFTTWILV